MPQNASPAVRRIVRITLKAGRAAEAREALRALARATRDEPACRALAFHQGLDDEHAVLLVEDVADSAALEAHLQQPHTQAFLPLGLVERIDASVREWIS